MLINGCYYYCCCCYNIITKPLETNWETWLKKMYVILQALTSPSVDFMLASCTTSRCAAWDTMGSDDREMMWSQTPDKVLHWGWDVSHELIVLPWQIYLHLLQFSRVSDSPHAGFCSLSHTRSSPGEYSEKHSYLQRMCPSRVIIGISAVGGYKKKKKSSSLAPITPNTPTQTCTNTKQMNHQCGGMSLSIFLSLPVFLYSFFCIKLSRSQPFSLPPFLFPT